MTFILLSCYSNQLYSKRKDKQVVRPTADVIILGDLTRDQLKTWWPESLYVLCSAHYLSLTLSYRVDFDWANPTVKTKVFISFRYCMIFVSSYPSLERTY